MEKVGVIIKRKNVQKEIRLRLELVILLGKFA